MYSSKLHVCRYVLIIVGFVLAGLLGDDPPAYAQKKHPAEEKGVKSVKGGPEASLRFRNSGPETVKVFWLDYEGKRVLLATLPAGATHEVATAALNHPYLVTDDKDNGLSIYYPDAQARTVVLGQGLDTKGDLPKRFLFNKTNPTTFNGLQSPLVQDEIKLDKEQLAKLTALVKKDAAARAAAKSGPFPDPLQETTKQIAKIAEATDDAAVALLTPEQKIRIKQIKKQQLDGSLFTDTGLVQALKLSVEQQSKFQEIRAEYLAKKPAKFFPGNKGNAGFSSPSLEPSKIFDLMARGRDFILISEFRNLKDKLTQYAKEKGIANEKITRDQFLDFYASLQKAKTADATNNDPGKQILQLRVASYDKAQALLDAPQRKVWQQLVGAPCKNYILPSVFNERPSSPKSGVSARGGDYKFNDWSCSTTRFLAEKSVQDELKLTDMQIKQIAGLGSKGFKAPTTAIPADLLTPVQLQRSRGIYLQESMKLYGPAGAFRYREVLELLNLRDQQKQEILAIGNADAIAIKSLPNQPEFVIGDQVRAINEATQQKLDRVLDDEQKTRLRNLVGEPFQGAISNPFRLPNGQAKKTLQ